ncbi:uncharacterized protein EI97DRAFT_245683 [Westerdykella ornata]|uniref:Uncharacterized protein n=1 Tax=Westerdykella ornata TaxID=318751 RepID=A0A6A6JQZ8_WESOR|nr:uncharacterized protein EI97DRAFT_245683 [Westerdykella ornata]KAF2278126.1 hypothetical protein EI97DRAFT_245683 [Westerdykella ornata]
MQAGSDPKQAHSVRLYQFPDDIPGWKPDNQASDVIVFLGPLALAWTLNEQTPSLARCTGTKTCWEQREREPCVDVPCARAPLSTPLIINSSSSTSFRAGLSLRINNRGEINYETPKPFTAGVEALIGAAWASTLHFSIFRASSLLGCGSTVPCFMFGARGIRDSGRGKGKQGSQWPAVSSLEGLVSGGRGEGCWGRSESGVRRAPRGQKTLEGDFEVFGEGNKVGEVDIELLRVESGGVAIHSRVCTYLPIDGSLLLGRNRRNTQLPQGHFVEVY